MEKPEMNNSFRYSEYNIDLDRKEQEKPTNWSIHSTHDELPEEQFKFT